MTLIRRSDVKNHLSTRSGSTSMFPSGLTRPDEAAVAPAGSAPETRADRTEIAISPDRAITPEPVLNPQAGDSVRIPAKAGNSGSPS